MKITDKKLTFIIVWAVFIGFVLGRFNWVDIHNWKWWVSVLLLNIAGYSIYFMLPITNKE